MSGELVKSITSFVRTLRAAGLPLGPSATLDALQVAETLGFARRDDFYWGLHAVLVKKRDHQALYDQAFHIFWRNPKYLERLMRMFLPEALSSDHESGAPKDQMKRRLLQALEEESQKPLAENRSNTQEEEQVELDAAFTFSEKEVLQTRDFDAMSTQELEDAKRAIQRMRFHTRTIATRRKTASNRGQIDPKSTLRAMSRNPAKGFVLSRRKPKRRHPPLVVLTDISGSMASYSRMLLFFLHALKSDRERVHAFVFGTRLTNISRCLGHRDVDDAMDHVSREVVDWSGGTRIGDSIDAFNRDWSRRVLGQGALVLLVTDGLDRGDDHLLDPALERLKLSARQLIWLNPLMRYDKYEARARGASIIVRHAHQSRSIHSLASIEELARLIATL